MSIFGFNQTHLANQLTDGKCNLIMDNIYRIIDEIEPKKRKFMRFPGGTVANEYNVDIYGHTLAEAKSSKWQRYKINPIIPFIQASKVIGWEIMPVINVTDIYNGKVTFEKGMEQNLRMIKMFLDAGLKVPYVEIGNELNIWMNISGSKDYNRNPSEYSREILKYFDISTKAHKAIKKEFPLIKTAGVSARNGLNARDNKWCSVFDKGEWNGIIIHHYEDNEDATKWLPNITAMVEQAKANGKELLLTEMNWRLGPSVTSLAYINNASKPSVGMYQENVWQLCEKSGVDYMAYHRIHGTDAHAYNYLVIK